MHTFEDEINIIICPYFFAVRPLLSIVAFSHLENGPTHQYPAGILDSSGHIETQ